MSKDTGSLPAYSLDEARQAYLGFADELTADGYRDGSYPTPTIPWVEDDWDADMVRAAKGYAALRGLPFPPADIDAAQDAVRRAEARVAAEDEDKAVAASIAEAERQLAEAKALGADSGRNAAEWVDAGEEGVGLAIIVRGYTDGDPAVLDALYLPDLSGEFADGWTPAALYEAVGAEPDDDGLDELCSAWEEAVQEAYFARIHDRLKAINPEALAAATRVG